MAKNEEKPFSYFGGYPKTNIQVLIFPTTILLYNAIHVWSKTIIFHFILTFWAVFSSEFSPL